MIDQFCGKEKDHVLHTHGDQSKYGCPGWPIPKEWIAGGSVVPEIEHKLTTDIRQGRAAVGDASDPVNHPLHYGGKDDPYEAIKVIHAWALGFDLGNVVKYISRAGKKSIANELEDMEKARNYLKFHIKELKKARKSAGD